MPTCAKKIPKQKGGDESSACQLEGPIGILWGFILKNKKATFNKNLVPFATQISEIVYQNCPTGRNNCKTTREEGKHELINAVTRTLVQFKEYKDIGKWEDENVIEMVVQFMQCIYLPIGRVTMNIDAFTDTFVSFMNDITRDNYVANFCEPREDIIQNGTVKQNDTYTCGRAISAIPYSCNARGKPRILFHRTKGRTDDIQDYKDPITYAENECQNAITDVPTFKLKQCKITTQTIAGGKKINPKVQKTLTIKNKRYIKRNTKQPSRKSV